MAQPTAVKEQYEIRDGVPVLTHAPHLVFEVYRRIRENGVVVYGNKGWAGNGFGNESTYVAVKDGEIVGYLDGATGSNFVGSQPAWCGASTFTGFVQALRGNIA